MYVVMAACLVTMLAMGFPLWVVFFASSLITLRLFTDVPLIVAAQAAFGALDNWLLIAVPGFILAGELMSETGMTQRMVAWIRLLTRRLRGGLPLATVAAAELFGAVSGSSAASTAAIGKVLYPGLRMFGYGERFSLGLIASCGALAAIMPPSINMILYSAVTNASVGQLFVAGVAPALLTGLLLAGYVILAERRGAPPPAPEPGSDMHGVAKATLDASWALGVPALIFGGIYSGVFTPTESAALSAVYAALVGIVVLRSLPLIRLAAALVSAATLTAKIFIIVAASSLFSWILTTTQAPQNIVSHIAAVGLPPWGVLLLVNLLLLVAGMFIDPTSAVVVLTPLLWPVAQAVGVDVIHFGIIVMVNLAVGMFTPPFGLNIFVCASILRTPASLVTISVVPFVLVYLASLALVTYIPAISLWLPASLLR